MKLNTETYSLPAYWASYLVNGDASSMEEAEQAQCDRFVADKGLGGCLNCSDESSFSRFHDAQYITGFVAADVLDFTFPVLTK